MPTTGLYEILAVGAQGGAGNANLARGGYGEQVSDEFDLVAGEVLTVAVGSVGLNGFSAGGTGGGGGSYALGSNAQSGTAGGNPGGGAGGTNGSDGTVGSGGGGWWVQGGRSRRERLPRPQ